MGGRESTPPQAWRDDAGPGREFIELCGRGESFQTLLLQPTLVCQVWPRD